MKKGLLVVFAFNILLLFVIASPIFAQKSDFIKDKAITIVGTGDELTSSNPDINTGEFVFYCQFDSPWRNNRYDTGTIGSSGCGPSSLAMILATYGLKARPGDRGVANPATVSELFTEKGFAWQPGNPYGYEGTSPFSIIDAGFLRSLGLKRAQIDLIEGGRDRDNRRHLTKADLEAVQRFTKQGWYMLGSAENWVGCEGRCNHTFVVLGANPSKEILIVASPSDKCGAKNYVYYPSLSEMNRYNTKFMSLVPIRKND